MLEYVGIASVRGARGFNLPVYQNPGTAERRIGYVIAGGYVPHFRATDDHGWLEVTMHNGDTGWLPYDREHVTVNLPDPTRIRVCIDPGHGGTEMGAVYGGVAEKDLNFDIAYYKLRPLLTADNRIQQVWYTRNGDYDVSLKYRWDLANASYASLFVSVHINANPDTSIRGTEVYFKCGAESTAELTADSRRAACLTAQRLREQVTQFGSPNCPWTDRGVVCRLVSQEDPRSYYFVLQNTNLPAMLAELGYLSNPGERACLTNDTFRGRLAQGLYNGITDTLFTARPGDTCTFSTLYGL